MRALAFGLAVLLVTPAADACPPPRLVDVLLTTDGTTLLDRGGIIIETRNGGGGGPVDLPNGELALTSGGTELVATRDYIAPGLSVLRPPPGKDRTIEAVGGDGQVKLTLKQDKAKTSHPAPKVVRLTSTLAAQRPSQRPPRPGQGIESSIAELTLSETPPDDVIAIVVFAYSKAGANGIAWWKPSKTDLVYAYSTGGKACVRGPSPIRQGEKVAIGFIDRNGRTSLLSKPFAVTAPRPPAKL